MSAAESVILPVNLDITGDLRVRGLLPSYSRTSLEQENLKAYPLELQLWRVFDAFGSLLGTPTADDLGITAGAFATGLPYLTAGDCKALGATTRRARLLFTLPPNYVAGESVRINAAAGMLTTVSDTSCVIDFEAYESARTTLKTGSDLVSTAATTINSLTFAEKPFEVDGTGLVPGDVLDIRLSITCTDAATGTAVIPAIAHLEMLLDIKG